MALVLCNNFFNGKTSFVDNKEQEWLLPNAIGFNDWVNKTFHEYKLSGNIETDTDDFMRNSDVLFPHQEFIKEFMRPGSPYRGLYVFHGLGSGKTRTSIVMSEQFRALGHKVVFISPAALSSNMIDELGKWGNEDVKSISDPKERRKYLRKYYSFVSINGTPIRKFTEIDLENKVIIIDEVHNLGSVMANKRNKKATAFYEWLMSVKNCKILALSGSPIINEPFELALVSNILRGPMDYEISLVNNKVIRNYKSVFPSDKKQFVSLFIDQQNNTLKNELIFKRRITGLFSYFYGIVGTKLPSLETILEEIPMSDYQYSMYVIARKYEIMVDKFSDKESEDSTSSYRNYSRQISNFVPAITNNLEFKELVVPENYENWSEIQQKSLQSKFGENMEAFLRFITEFKEYSSVEEKIDALQEYGKEFVKVVKVTKRDDLSILKSLNSQTSFLSENLLEKLPTYSTKLLKVLDNIENGKGKEGKVFLYSHYRNYSGIGIMKEILKQQGYEEINENNVLSFNAETMEPALRYGFFVGGVSNEIRYKIKEIYNHSNNMHGELMKIFMGTQAAAEGISLKHVQQVHVLEPYWNNVRIQQVIGRARRLGSHVGLPPEEQTVYAYMYFSVLSESHEKIEVDTTDTHIYNNALLKQQLNDQFLKAIKSSAVDCTLNFAQNSLVDKDYICYVPDPEKTKETIAWNSDINVDLKRLEGVEVVQTIVKSKFLNYPRPHHINIFKLYNQELYEPKNTIFSGTIENVADDGTFTFSSKMDTIKIMDYYKGFYVHIFSQQQKGYVISGYNFATKTLSVTGLSSETIDNGMRFWIYRPKYVAKIVNNDIYKEDNAVVLYDRNYLVGEQKWIPRMSLVMSSDERDASFKMF